MSSSRSQLPVMLLCLLGLVVQFLGGGLSGGALCIGCERSGLTVVPTDKAVASDCCKHESEPAKGPQTPSSDREMHCGCVVVPLARETRLSVSAPRVETRADDVTTPVATPIVSMIVAWPVCQPVAYSRAGPSHPPRQLTPSSRFTVLVI